MDRAKAKDTMENLTALAAATENFRAAYRTIYLGAGKRFSNIDKPTQDPPLARKQAALLTRPWLRAISRQLRVVTNRTHQEHCCSKQQFTTSMRLMHTTSIADITAKVHQWPRQPSAHQHYLRRARPRLINTPKGS